MAQDADIFRDIKSRIVHTGYFPWVRWGQANTPFPAEYPAVLIYRASFNSPRHSQTSDSKRRRVAFHVELLHAGPDPETLSQQAIEYEALIINRIDGQSLGGITSPQFTWLETGKDDPRPETNKYHIVLTGEFSYLIDTEIGLAFGMDDYTPGVNPDAPGYGHGHYGQSPYGR